MHTPGPWNIDNQYRNAISSSTPNFICHVAEIPGETDDNLKLIAAAPEMLDALRAARLTLSNIPKAYCNIVVLSKIESAIAKAEGK